MSFLAYVAALLSGVAIVCQTGSNSELKQKLGEPSSALLINYVVGITSVLLAIVITRQPMAGLQHASQVPWWGWLGRFLGAASGIVAIVLAKQLGAGALAGFALAGQLIGSVLLDHFRMARIRTPLDKSAACSGLRPYDRGTRADIEILDR